MAVDPFDQIVGVVEELIEWCEDRVERADGEKTRRQQHILRLRAALHELQKEQKAPKRKWTETQRAEASERAKRLYNDPNSSFGKGRRRVPLALADDAAGG